MRRILTATTAIATLAGAPAHAASVSTDVDVTLNNVIALYCYDTVSVNVTAANFIAAVGGIDGEQGLGSAGSITATGTSGTWTAALDATTDAATADAVDSNADLVMTNVCAYRAVSSAGVKVEGALNNGGSGSVSLVSDYSVPSTGGGAATPSTAHIDVTGISIRDGSTSGAAWGSDYTVPGASLGFGNLKAVDVRLPLDLADATDAATYSVPTVTSTTGGVTTTSNPGVFTITVTAL